MGQHAHLLCARDHMSNLLWRLWYKNCISDKFYLITPFCWWVGLLLLMTLHARTLEDGRLAIARTALSFVKVVVYSTSTAYFVAQLQTTRLFVSVANRCEILAATIDY